MERISIDHFGRSSLRAEHEHRYQLAALLATGVVVDCACGVGYGSQILKTQPHIRAYYGIDPDEDSVSFAQENYATPGFSFSVGTLEKNGAPLNSIDTFVMLETLEHTEDPEAALEAVRRHISETGVLLGSVPSAEYDELCGRIYGENPYHLQRFTAAGLKQALERHFETAIIFSAEFVMGTLFRPLSSDATAPSEHAHIVPRETNADSIDGSLYFIAGSCGAVSDRLAALGEKIKFFEGPSKARVDSEEVEEVRKAYLNTEKLLVETQSAYSFADDLASKRYEIITNLTEELIGEREKSNIANLLATKIVDSVGPLASLAAISDKQYAEVPFVDLAYSLYVFISRLRKSAFEKGTKDLYFFSREGFALKEMFDYFNDKHQDNENIISHYLEISRRSSFLPSLGSLDEEDFDVLFRQYRQISVRDFLSSLALESHTDALCKDLKLEVKDIEDIQDDLPHSDIFRKLKSSNLFRDIYEIERNARSNALAVYIASLGDGALPSEMNIVDVGWKGSIQDNLSNWLSRVKGESAHVHGYYVGLIAPGAANNRNTKAGLVFSNQSGLSTGFRVFNENRSLFEVLLPAMHGGPYCYTVDEEGRPQVLRSHFSEGDMIRDRVMPVYSKILLYFKNIVDVLTLKPSPDEALFSETLKKHARMVYEPRQQEIDWMLSVSHVENFGVFQESSFKGGQLNRTLFDRVRFSANLLSRRRPSEIGFWPYLTLRQRGLPGMHVLYRHFRKRQPE